MKIARRAPHRWMKWIRNTGIRQISEWKSERKADKNVCADEIMLVGFMQSRWRHYTHAAMSLEYCSFWLWPKPSIWQIKWEEQTDEQKKNMWNNCHNARTFGFRSKLVSLEIFCCRSLLLRHHNRVVMTLTMCVRADRRASDWWMNHRQRMEFLVYSLVLEVFSLFFFFCRILNSSQAVCFYFSATKKQNSSFLLRSDVFHATWKYHHVSDLR